MNNRIIKTIACVFLAATFVCGCFLAANFVRGLNAYRTERHLIGKDTVVYWNDGEFQICGGDGTKFYMFAYNGDTITEEVEAYKEVGSYVYILDSTYYIIVDQNNCTFAKYTSTKNIDEAHRYEFNDLSSFTYLTKSGK